MNDADMEFRRPGGAVLSPCGLYRYHLTRTVAPSGGTVLWVMLNPSVADADTDDPTIRRCKSFTKAWGRGELQVVNLFALRSTKPAGLWAARNAVGPDNDAWIERTARDVAARPRGLVVCAWGAGGGKRALMRAIAVEVLLRRAGVALHRLGVCEERGEPRHPLRLSGAAQLEAWGSL